MGGAQEILACDPSIFTVPTTTTVEDRKSLLRLQNVARTRGLYHYLEVGSHLGGSLVPHLIDPLCAGIVSIDTRPPANPDIRGRMSLYPNNSTERMLAILRKEVGEAVSKIETFDTEAAVAVQSVKTKVDLAFIDGEHTNRATFADFIAVREMTKPDAIIGFHDSPPNHRRDHQRRNATAPPRRQALDLFPSGLCVCRCNRQHDRSG